MTRPITLFTGQWADLPLATLARKAAEWGYDGLELACWGDHFDVSRALAESGYCAERRALLADHGLEVYAISNHLVGQATCDLIDDRHRAILPEHVWGDGQPSGVRRRAAEEMKRTAEAAALLGVKVVNGFTGSGIWHLMYAFPPLSPDAIDEGFREFGACWVGILEAFRDAGVKFGLEVHPTEIAFDLVTAQRALAAVDHHPAFGFNYDPSHFAYQGVDYLAFLEQLHDRIVHAHMKDVWWSDTPKGSGVFGGHLAFGDGRRWWDFRSLGRGRVDFEAIVRVLNRIGYDGPLSVEWEDVGMDREHGAREACAFLRRADFSPSEAAFDAAFERKGRT
jgi:sugar phosphate isomerase/epimerase